MATPGVVGDQRTLTQPLLSPHQRLRVQHDAVQIFYEDWASGAVDTTINWNAAVTSAGGTSTPSAGSEVLASGVTASSYAYLVSKQKFQPVAPGFIEYDHQIQFTYPFPVHSYAFWGCGNFAAAPSATTYGVDAVGFEISTTGKVSAVTWAGVSGVGTRTAIPDIYNNLGGGLQIQDSNVHRFQIFLRGDTMFWLIDNVIVASIATGALGPNVNTLPVAMFVGNDASGSTGMSVTSAAIYVADTTAAYISGLASTAGGVATFAATGGTGNALLTNSAVAVKTTPGNLYGFTLYNAGVSAAFVQFFDVASGSVTLGTTVPKLSYWIPAGGGYDIPLNAENKISFYTAITVAATTTATGNGAPATGVQADIYYR